jgi:hypothetical protein
MTMSAFVRAGSADASPALRLPTGDRVVHRRRLGLAGFRTPGWTPVPVSRHPVAEAGRDPGGTSQMALAGSQPSWVGSR